MKCIVLIEIKWYLKCSVTLYILCALCAVLCRVFAVWCFIVHGYWHEWSNWTSCNVSCGGGSIWRRRRCELPLFGGDNCTGPSEETQDCNTFPCPGKLSISTIPSFLEATHELFLRGLWYFSLFRHSWWSLPGVDGMVRMHLNLRQWHSEQKSFVWRPILRREKLYRGLGPN